MNLSFGTYENLFTDEQRKKMFGESLKSIRISKGFSQADIYNFLNIKASTYNSYEKGNANPSMETIVRLSYVLGCSTDDLLQKYNYVGDRETQLSNVMQQMADLKELFENPQIKENKEIASALTKVSDLAEAMCEALKKDENK